MATSQLSEKARLQQQMDVSESANSSKSPAPSFQTTVASLSLHQNDRIRLMAFPSHIIQAVRQAITSSWPRGLQDQREYYGSHEFKLYGNPWLGQGAQATESRRLMRTVISTLYDLGWVLALSTDVSKKQTDKDTLIFRYQDPAPVKSDWISISFSQHDRIRLYDAPQALIDAVHAAIRPMVQTVISSGQHGIWEVKILGYPWYATGGDSMTARKLLLLLFSALEQLGYTVYASIDQKATTAEGRSESDTWHCRREQGWSPGAPVYHA